MTGKSFRFGSFFQNCVIIANRATVDYPKLTIFLLGAYRNLWKTTLCCPENECKIQEGMSKFNQAVVRVNLAKHGCTPRVHGFVIYYQCVLQKQFCVLKQGVRVFLVLRTNKREASCIDEALACLNFEISRVGVLIIGSFSALTSLSEFCWERMSFVGISFYVLSLLFGPCRLSEFTLLGPHRSYK